MTSPWTYFTLEEFECHCGCGKALMDTDFVDILDEMRGLMGVPFIITSGYRCPKYNKEVSTTGETGPHTTGKAVDLALNRENAYTLLMIVPPEITGIGIAQKGPDNTRFIHLDALETGVRPTVWSY